MDVHQFTHPKVRDLAWALGSPSLIEHQANIPMLSSDWWTQEFVFAQDWLRELDKNPSILLSYLDPNRGKRIGLAFEDLLRCWLDWHPNYTCLASDMAIYDNKRTVGAFDFLIQTPLDILHLEVAVKFYLCLDNSELWHNWIGPSRKDHLGKKLRKMKDHQLQLLLTEMGQESLKKHHLPQPTKIRGTIKGIFFQYWGSEEILPKNGHVVDGVWMFADDFIDVYRGCEPQCRFVERKRPDWLAPLQKIDVDDWKIEDILVPKMFSQMIYIDSIWREELRIMVVPNHWNDLERIV